MRQIPIADVALTDHHKELVAEVLDSNRLSYGDKTRQFEAEFALRNGKKHAVFMNSGTSALQAAIHALKITHGWSDEQEVIVPAITFPATINTVLHNNLQPVFVDVSKDYNINAALIERAITDRTVALLPVSMFGQPAQLEELQALADRFNLSLIVDACESSFSQIGDEPAGRFGDIVCHSTYLAHIISTGVGGFATTDDDDLALLMRSLIWHGRDGMYLSKDDISLEVVSRRFNFEYVGYNFRLTELEAALGLAELNLVDEYIETRRRNARLLTEKLSSIEQLILPRENPGTSHVWMFYAILLGSDTSGQTTINIAGNNANAYLESGLGLKQRDALVEHLEAQGIETRYLMPITNQPVYQKLALDFNECHFAQRVNEAGLLIGCHQHLTSQDLEYVAERFYEFFA